MGGGVNRPHSTPSFSSVRPTARMKHFGGGVFGKCIFGVFSPSFLGSPRNKRGLAAKAKRCQAIRGRVAKAVLAGWLCGCIDGMGGRTTRPSRHSRGLESAGRFGDSVAVVQKDQRLLLQ